MLKKYHFLLFFHKDGLTYCLIFGVHYTYRLIKEQNTGQYAEWIIEVPNNEETINLYGYRKSLLIVRQDNFVITRAVHWLKNKNTLKNW